MATPKVKNADDRVKFFEQAAGYLAWCIDHEVDAGPQLCTLTHDILSLARQDEGFSPRVSSYRKYWKG